MWVTTLIQESRRSTLIFKLIQQKKRCALNTMNNLPSKELLVIWFPIHILQIKLSAISRIWKKSFQTHSCMNVFLLFLLWYEDGDTHLKFATREARTATTERWHGLCDTSTKARWTHRHILDYARWATRKHGELGHSSRNCWQDMAASGTFNIGSGWRTMSPVALEKR